MRQDLHADGRGADLPAGPVQQAHAQDLLKGQHVPGHRRLGDAQVDGRVRERSRVRDRHQAAKVTQLKIHNLSV